MSSCAIDGALRSLQEVAAGLERRLAKVAVAIEALEGLDDEPPAAPELPPAAKVLLEHARAAKPRPAKAPKPPAPSERAGRTTPEGWTTKPGGTCSLLDESCFGPVTTHTCAAEGCGFQVSRCAGHAGKRLGGIQGGHTRTHQRAARKAPAGPKASVNGTSKPRADRKPPEAGAGRAARLGAILERARAKGDVLCRCGALVAYSDRRVHLEAKHELSRIVPAVLDTWYKPAPVVERDE